MAKKYYCVGLILSCAVLFCLDCFGQVGLASGAKVKPKPVEVTPNFDSTKYKLREKVIALAKKEVGVVEKTGRNDHPRILVYHAAVSKWLASYRPIQPYCASFVYYIFTQAGVNVTRVANPARARDWFKVPSRIVLTQQSMRGNQRMMKPPDKGAVVGYIFYGNQISHIEILDRIDFNEGYIYCIGGNTSSRGSAMVVDREGNGVYYVKRKIKMFYAIAEII